MSMLQITKHRAVPVRVQKALCYLYDVWQNSRIDLYPVLALPQAEDFHKSTKRFKVLLGGNRAAKSNTAECEIAMAALGRNFWREYPPPPLQILVLTNDFDTAKTVQRQGLLDWLPADQIERMVWNNQERVIELRDGSQIHFKSWTRGMAPLMGRKLDIVWLDEEPKDPDVIIECRMRLIDRRGTIIISCTPYQGYSILYSLVEKNETNNPEIAKWNFWMRHNYYLPYDVVREQEREFANDEPNKKTRLYGEFALATGLVYGGYFDPAINILTRDKQEETEARRKAEHWRGFRALDPGTTKAVCKCYTVAPEGDIYCYREIVMEGKGISEQAAIIQNECWGEDFAFTVCGVYGADSHVMLEMPRHGVSLIGSTEFFGNLKGARGIGSDESLKLAGISRLKEWLKGIPTRPPAYKQTIRCEKCFYTVNFDIRHPICPRCGEVFQVKKHDEKGYRKRLYYYRDCKLTLEEFSLYRMDEKGLMPIEENCDALSADRYAVSTFPAPQVPREIISPWTMEAFEKQLELARIGGSRPLIGG